MRTHSSILAWRTPWTESGGLQSTGSQTVGHGWSDLAHTHSWSHPAKTPPPNDLPRYIFWKSNYWVERSDNLSPIKTKRLYWIIYTHFRFRWAIKLYPCPRCDTDAFWSAERPPLWMGPLTAYSGHSSPGAWPSRPSTVPNPGGAKDHTETYAPKACTLYKTGVTKIAPFIDLIRWTIYTNTFRTAL